VDESIHGFLKTVSQPGARKPVKNVGLWDKNQNQDIRTQEQEYYHSTPTFSIAYIYEHF
jgi:hypothetical protein